MLTRIIRICSWHLPWNMIFLSQFDRRQRGNNCSLPRHCLALAFREPRIPRSGQHIWGSLAQKFHCHRLGNRHATRKSNQKWTFAHRPYLDLQGALLVHSAKVYESVCLLVEVWSKLLLTMTIQALDPFSRSLKGRTLTATLTLLIVFFLQI